MKAKKVITLATVPLDDEKAKALREIADDEEIILSKELCLSKENTRWKHPEQREVACARLSASTSGANRQNQH